MKERKRVRSYKRKRRRREKREWQLWAVDMWEMPRAAC